MLRQRDKESYNLLLLALYAFHEHGEDEVCLSEILECFKHLEGKIQTKYKFLDRFLYSPQLLEDLRDLSYQGLVRRFAYQHDAFLPKTYFMLTDLGKLYGKRSLSQSNVEELEKVNNFVRLAIENHRKRWKFWARSKQSPENVTPIVQ
jgi:uncharacterized protein YwgA